MRFGSILGRAVIATLFLAGCVSDSDKDRCGEGFYYEGESCYKFDTDSGGGSDTDTIIDPTQWIGSACSCEGEDCVQLGLPVPNATPIVGCDDTPTDWPGAERVCLRSYQGELSNDMHYANGFCSVMAVACTGEDLICNATVIGDHDAMVACPSGSIMISSSQDVSAMGVSATLFSKVCAPTCETDGDCREGEYDSLFEEISQYQCYVHQAIKFCYDPRSLAADSTIQEF